MATSALLAARIATRGCFLRSVRPQMLVAGQITAQSRPLQPHEGQIVIRSSATAAGSAGKHWRNEKIFTVGLLGLIPLGLVYPNAVVDYGLAVAIPLHGHWGFESVIEDYVPQALKKVSHGLLYCVSIATFAGLMYLNYADVGICKAVKMIWSL